MKTEPAIKHTGWKLIIGIIISAAFLYLAFRNVDPKELRMAFENADYWYAIPAACLSLLSIWFRAVRWRYLLNPIKKIGLASLFSSASIGFMANSVLPARLGEVVRAYVIGRKEQISKSTAFATVVVARIFDGMTILMLVIFVLLRYSYDYPGWLQKIVYVAFIFYFFALAFILFLKLRSDQSIKVVSFILKPFPEKVQFAVSRFVSSFINGLGIIKSYRNVLGASLSSILVWLPIAFIIYILAHSFNIDLPFSGALLMLAIYTFGMMIPSAPGFVGTIQYFSVMGLSIFGVSRATAFGFSVVYHLCTFLPITVVGFVFLIIEGYTLMELKKSAGSADDV
jgi:uncharacterized protein (TIRG00374 family)